LVKRVNGSPFGGASMAAFENEILHMQRILDSLPYRIMVVNMDFTIEKVNKTFLREFQLAGKNVIGQNCFKMRYGLDKPCDECGRTCYIEEVKTTGKLITVTQKYMVATRDEECFEIVNTSPIYDDSGNLIQIVESSRDITERVNLEREVDRSKIFFENVIKNSADGIVFLDTKGKILIFNDAMERMTGFSAEDIKEKKHVSSFYDIELGRENMMKMRSNQHGSSGKLNPTSMTITAKNGEKIPVTLSASLITIDGQEVGSVGVFTDMREVFQMRKDLEETQLQLIQADKVASVGRMAAGVAHEINNPLSGVLIYAELLKDELKNNPELKKDAEEIIAQTIRCKKIISELLEFSRQSIGEASYFSLEHLIPLCLNLLLKQAFFHDIEVFTNIEPGLPQVHGDMGQLQQVFTNLFINAAHAMDGKGKLLINASLNTDTNNFVIKISDTGPGIPEQVRDKVFDVFFTTKPVGQGTGLGLSISQNIINLHGGSLTFECPETGGTIFVIELPLEAGEQNKSEASLFIGLDE
jgi:PAS domain S-box-containing protein